MAGEKIPYWQQRRESKLGKVLTPQQERQEKKDALSVWFEMQATMAPAKCENCDRNLSTTISFHPRAHICHILPKTKDGGCPSVATHPLNRWFGCLDCHTAYDRESADVVETMRVVTVCRERVSKFYKDIAPDELRRVPEFLRPKDAPPKIQEVKKPKENAKTKDKPRRGAGGKFEPKKLSNNDAAPGI